MLCSHACCIIICQININIQQFSNLFSKCYKYTAKQYNNTEPTNNQRAIFKGICRRKYIRLYTYNHVPIYMYLYTNLLQCYY